MILRDYALGAVALTSLANRSVRISDAFDLAAAAFETGGLLDRSGVRSTVRFVRAHTSLAW
jgi:hypothetical protein